MRIPGYNGNFEEPWYWDVFGFDIYSYSFFMDKYQVLGKQEDLQQAQKYQKLVPAAILADWMWRRARNFNVTMNAIEQQATLHMFNQVYITLDDNAEYGFNIKEANKIEKRVAELELEEQFNIYPGADEVLLTVLSRLSVDHNARKPLFKIVYRNDSTQAYIPNYEGQPLNISVLSQIRGAGGIIAQEGEQADIYLLMNNWNTKIQEEASGVQTQADYTPLLPYITLANGNVAFADVRYSNGGDKFFVQWMNAQKLNVREFSYAGWNTNGNTLGTVISNVVLLNLFGAQTAYNVNAHFQSLRFLEDLYYQAIIRTNLNNYLFNIAFGSGDTVSDLSHDLPFYQDYVQKGLVSFYGQLQQVYAPFTMYHVQNTYFPWNRTFELGFEVKH